MAKVIPFVLEVGSGADYVAPSIFLGNRKINLVHRITKERDLSLEFLGEWSFPRKMGTPHIEDEAIQYMLKKRPLND